ncbi:cell division protein FtsH, partial [Acinetobacter baumannii]|nr:cell division protein FtsH [Acinetobacter baumannii]
AYSEETANEIDEEVKRIVHEGYEKAQAILNEHMDKLLAVADALMELETIDGDQFERIYSGEITVEGLVEEFKEKVAEIDEKNKEEASNQMKIAETE